jgi:hypothetical protein
MLLITSLMADKDTRSIASVAQALGWSVCNDGWHIPERLKGEQGAAFGTKIFVEQVANQMGWRIIANPEDWTARLPEEYVSRKIGVIPTNEARKIIEPKFMKTIGKEWYFESRIFELGEELPPYVLGEVPVLVSDVLRYTSKYRCFIKNRKVITSCCYYLRTKQMENASMVSELNLPKNYVNNYDDVVLFVDRMLQDDRVECVQACAIDVCRFDKDKYAVIGSSSACTTAPIGCELTAVFDAVKTTCVPRAN